MKKVVAKRNWNEVVGGREKTEPRRCRDLPGEITSRRQLDTFRRTRIFETCGLGRIDNNRGFLLIDDSYCLSLLIFRRVLRDTGRRDTRACHHKSFAKKKKSSLRPRGVGSTLRQCIAHISKLFNATRRPVCILVFISTSRLKLHPATVIGTQLFCDYSTISARNLFYSCPTKRVLHRSVH